MLNFHYVGAQSIEVCYGRLGNNLPTPLDVINLYKANVIKGLRIYEPNHEVLDALRDSNIEVILDLPNTLLKDLNKPLPDVINWVNANIITYYPRVKIKYIAIGNEVSPISNQTSQFAPLILPAMQNVQQALTTYHLQDQIKVSTVIYSGILVNIYPPWNAVFREDLRKFINPIIQFLVQNNNSPLLANIYPYFAYHGDPDHVSLPYISTTKSRPNRLYQSF